MTSTRIQSNFSPHSSQNDSAPLRLVPRINNQHSAENGNRAQGILNSWKEIATYLDRGIRTVQRWESDLQLPIHRPKGKNRSAVLALQEELDDWLRRTPSQFESKETCNRLFEIACVLQGLAERVVTQSNSYTPPEGEELLEELNTVVRELAQLNGGSWKDHSQTPSIEAS